MQQIIEILGANVIGGLIMLIGLNLNIQINSAVRNIFENTYQIRSAVTSFEVIDYDVSKAGNNVTGEKIVQADSNALKFKADINNTGVVSTVYYYTSSDSVMNQTKNPHDKQLLRKIDNNDANVVGVVTRLNFVYYDSIGNKILYSSLSSSASRAKIRNIRIYVRSESADPVDGIYIPVEWRSKFRPTNLL